MPCLYTKFPFSLLSLAFTRQASFSRLPFTIQGNIRTMGHKRRISEDADELRKKPVVCHTYNLRGAAQTSTQGGGDLEEEDIHLRLSNLRLNQVRFPISRAISEFVHNVGNEQYEFDIPFHTLTKFHRIAWGVKESAKSILFRLEFLCHENNDYVGFCIHCPPRDREFEYHHNYCTTDGPWKDFVFCNTEPNFLTDTLSRKLHKLLGQGKWTAQKIYDKIVEVASSDPTVKCLICGKGLDCKVFRPLPCSEACRKEFENFPLTTRLAPFLRDPGVLDFLLCCLGSTTWNEAKNISRRSSLNLRPRFKTNLPPTCPIDKEQLHDVLDSFPAISSGTTVSQLLEPREFRNAREALLNWLCFEFDGTLVTVTALETAHISELPGAGQFLLLNGNIEQQTAFEKELASSHIGSGFAGFHGTSPDNLFNILQEGLKASEHFDTVFGSEEPADSITHGLINSIAPRFSLRGWKNSAFNDAVVLFGVEVVSNDSYIFESEVDSQQDTVMVRYVFLLPPSLYEFSERTSTLNIANMDDILPTSSDTIISMEETYRRIKSGRLLEAKEKQAQGREGQEMDTLDDL